MSDLLCTTNKDKNFKTEDCFDVKEVTRRLGYKSTESVFQMIYAKLFPNALKLKNKWWIPISDLDAYKVSIENCLCTEEVANRLGYKSSDNILALLKENKFPNAFKIRSKWWIPSSDVESYKQVEIKSLDIKNAAKRLDRNTFNISDLIKKNKFLNAFKHSGKWWIPIQDIEKYEQEILDNTYDDCLDTPSAASRLGYKSSSYITVLINKNMFPNAFKNELGKWCNC